MFTPTKTNQVNDLYIWRGCEVPQAAEICVIVMSTDSDARSVAAAQSVLDDAPNVEVAIVNTGKGSLKKNIQSIENQVILVETNYRQYAGGTRNIGINVTHAPIVAFLAADCKVTKNWVKIRIDAHKSHRSVASALIPMPHKNKKNTSSWASCIVTHGLRLPECSAEKASLHGLSYDRKIFEEVGLFDETTRVGEDTILNQEIAKRISPPLWCPKIVTMHQYPISPLEAAIDQFSRGRRESNFQTKLKGIGLTTFVAKNLKRRMSMILRMSGDREVKRKYSSLIFLFSAILTLFRCLGNLFPISN